MQNHREIQTIVDLARHYYDKKNYCILTPYDAQRNELQKKLKSEGLRWDNVYNVDSYQGSRTQKLAKVLYDAESNSKYRWRSGFHYRLCCPHIRAWILGIPQQGERHAHTL